MCPLFLLLTLHAFHSCPRHSFFAHQHPLVLIRPVPRRPFLAMASTPTPPCGLALIPGLPPVAQAVLHRELLLVHAFLAQIHAILHRPLGLRTTPLMDRVTHPHLRAQLEGLDNTLLLALRVNHTAFTTPMSSSLPWVFFILYITVLNNLKLNFKAVRTLAIGHLSLYQDSQHLQPDASIF